MEKFLKILPSFSPEIGPYRMWNLRFAIADLRFPSPRRGVISDQFGSATESTEDTEEADIGYPCSSGDQQVGHGHGHGREAEAPLKQSEARFRAGHEAERSRLQGEGARAALSTEVSSTSTSTSTSTRQP